MTDSSVCGSMFVGLIATVPSCSFCAEVVSVYDSMSVGLWFLLQQHLVLFVRKSFFFSFLLPSFTLAFCFPYGCSMLCCSCLVALWPEPMLG